MGYSIKSLTAKSELFSYRVEDSGAEYTWAVDPLVKWVEEQIKNWDKTPLESKELKLFRITVNPEEVALVRETRGIEQPRLDRLVEPYLSRPIIFAEYYDGTHILVDGNHRFVRNGELGKDWVYGVVLPPATWERFLIVDAPPLKEGFNKSPSGL